MRPRRLKRFWARVRLLLFCGVVGGCLLTGFLEWAGASKWALLAAALLTMALLIAMSAVSLRFLRCTTCGKNIASGGWSSGRRGYCPCCGRPFLFDDDPPDPEETAGGERRESP